MNGLFLYLPFFTGIARGKLCKKHMIIIEIHVEYIGRIHEQIKHRPDYIVESIIIDGHMVDDIEGLKSIENSLVRVPA